MSQISVYAFGGPTPPGTVETLTGNSGGPVGPTGNNIDVLGGNNITVTGNPGTSTLTVDVTGTTNHSLLAGNASGSITSLGVATNGQLPIGSTGANPVLSTLTAGSNVTITNGAGSITINSFGEAGTVTEIDGDTGTAVGPVITFTGVPAGGTVTFEGNNASGVSLHVTDASFNTVIGGASLMNLLAGGSDNTYVGYGNGRALAINGDDNIAIGVGLFNNLTTGDANIAIGVAALTAVAEGIANVAIGSNALAANNDDHNIAIGMNALTNATGASNIAIGYQAGIGLVTGSSNIYLHDSGIDNDASTLRVGTAAGATPLSKAFIGGIDGVNIGSVAKVVTMSATGDQLGTATITAGAGISVTPGANTITIASTAGDTWSIITADQSAVAGNGYICNKAGLLTLTLPATSVAGDIIEVTGMNTNLGWKIAQNAGQQIHYGAANTTVGVTGSLASALTYDAVKIVCNVAGASAEWIVLSSVGVLTIS